MTENRTHLAMMTPPTLRCLLGDRQKQTGQGSSGGMDHSHIPEEPSYGGEKGRSNVAEFYEEEEEDGAYIIEYSNPEEEGESCKFKMLVDRLHPGKKPVIKPLPVREIPKEPLSFRPQKQTCETSQRMKMKTDELQRTDGDGFRLR
ncbi:hypothetical protein ILYODFUR_001164 [Ilyodon furcidens]|uniref:Uncharacterized protein n=1 Tax=Ilyodon furcidens TaxID=33524 RepID=A0ABV0VA34_9TELE